MLTTKVSNYTISQAVLRTIQNVFESHKPANIKIADLGCLHGYYSNEFGQHGYKVTGIEARESNYQKCLEVKMKSQNDNLYFVHDDAKNLEHHGHFDVVFCSGLLYHLDKPIDFINLMSKVTNKLLIIQTHYSISNDSLYDYWLKKRLHLLLSRYSKSLLKRKNYNLSTKDENEGFEGRWFIEYPSDATRNEIESKSRAAFSNEKSFWLTKPALLEAIQQSGFSTVYEQFDYIPDIDKDDYQFIYNRGLFIGIK